MKKNNKNSDKKQILSEWRWIYANFPKFDLINDAKMPSDHSATLGHKETRTGTQMGQEPGGKSCRGRGGVLLNGLLPLDCSAFLFIFIIFLMLMKKL